MNIPIIQTSRLTLRPFSLDDAPDVQRLAGDKAIAETTVLVPHPYEDGLAEEWICSHQPNWDKRKSIHWAVVLSSTNELIGAITIRLDFPNEKGNLGYWIGKPYWNNGYVTEVSQAAVDWAFKDLSLNRIESDHFSSNPASGAVMRKLGMVHEGTMRQYVKKWDKFIDGEFYAILKQDWQTNVN